MRYSIKQAKFWWNYRQHIIGIVGILILASVLVVLPMVVGIPKTIAAAPTGSWPTYMGNIGHTGFNGAETIISPTSVAHLKLHWKLKAAGLVTTQPVEANGLVYWGSWDGIEHATNPTTGVDSWTANLGQSKANCSRSLDGVISSAAVSSVSINGVTTPVDFVGGGNATMYALNANTGAVIWQTSLGATQDHFLYSSAVVYNGNVYMGVASHDDCPLIQGQLVELNASTGVIQHTFNVVPNGCTGGSIWVAPTIDTATNILYMGTGNLGACATSETTAVAMVALNATDLSLVASWQVPQAQQSSDGDFGSTATLFTATIGGTVRQMVGLLNKNGFYYAFDRSNIKAGPLWEDQLASTATDVENNVASSGWDGTTLYAVAASTTINGVTCGGSLRALNPATGGYIWQDCLKADVLAPVTLVKGLAEVGSGTSFIFVNTKTGKRLFSFQDKSATSHFEGPGSISSGVLYHGNTDGYLYAFGM